MSREQLIGLIQADAKFMDERELIADYIRSLPIDQPLEEGEIRKGYEAFKVRRRADELAALAQRHELEPDAFKTFVDDILRRRVFDGEALSALMEKGLMQGLFPTLEAHIA